MDKRKLKYRSISNSLFTRKDLLTATAMTIALCFSYSPSSHASSGFYDPGGPATSAGAAIGGLAPTSESFDGGEITIGSTGQTVTLFRNEGGRPVNIKGIKLYPSSTVSASIGLDECSGQPLPGGAECPIVVSVK
ncbi:MAG: hypothetical protein ACPG05_03405, partial [Bdellovibrionales bacterium]